METLGKLNINPERLLKDNELKSLTGGWSGTCSVYSGDQQIFSGGAYGSGLYGAYNACISFWGSEGCQCVCY